MVITARIVRTLGSIGIKVVVDMVMFRVLKIKVDPDLIYLVFLGVPYYSVGN